MIMINKASSDAQQYQDSISLTTTFSPDIFRVRIANDQISHQAIPGQFINIKITENYQPLWRRPFSIHRVNKAQGWFEILFRVVGKGTTILSQKQVMEPVDYLGPLGKGFQFVENEPDPVFILGGGLGIAPLLFLAEELIKLNIIPQLFYGVKTKSEFCCLPDFENLNLPIHLATEDGSLGSTGFVTTLLEQHISKHRQARIFACGPNPMLKQVIMIASQYNFQCQVSLETLMACGFGVCLGCGIKSKRADCEYLYVCKDGPVFNANEIELNDEFIR
jgi:dihydroorotate dehydrogenase electron transfer subunit